MDVETKIAGLLFVGFVIGLAVFIGTLISIYKNRSNVNSQRAAKTGAFIALVAGLMGLLHWATRGNEPTLPFALISIPLFYMAPAFVISFYASLALFQRSDARQDRN